MNESLEARVEELVAFIDALRPETASLPTLVYFNIIGIAWPIRCLLHLKQVEYSYVPISIQEWSFRSSDGCQILKNAFSNGHVPLYVDQDISLNQSTLILKILAHKHGLMGSDDAQALQIESVLAHCYDALFSWGGILPVNVRLNIPDEVAQARLNAFMGDGVWGLATNGYRSHLDGFMNILEANPSGSGFLVGERLSAADLSAFNVLGNWYKAFDRQVFADEYPLLDDYIHRIAADPAIASYIREIQEPTLWFELPTVALRLTSREELEGLVDLP